MKKLKEIKINIFPNLSDESKETIESRQVFFKQFVNPNDLVFDVGANLGNRTRPLLNVGAKVVAVEPQKMCYKILQKKFGNKITIVPMGLGEEEAIKDFYTADTHVLSTFSSEWIDKVKNERFKNYFWNKPVKIQMTTLDKLIETYGSPKFIKIDVEGYELEVLKGLTKAIDMISFEYAVPEQIQKLKDCISQIEKYNSDIECNYAMGEAMAFGSKEWLSANDFRNHISTSEFISTSWGDIYVRKSVK